MPNVLSTGGSFPPLNKKTVTTKPSQSTPRTSRVLKYLDQIFEGQADDAYGSWSDLPDEELRAFGAREAYEGCGMRESAEYGEMTPRSMIDLLEALDPRPGQYIYDLGSGVGKFVVLGWMFGMKAIGIELSHSRWQRSQKACQQLRSMNVDFSKDLGVVSEWPCPLMIHGNILEFDFSNADIVFMNNPMFPERMMETLLKKIRALNIGTKIVSFQCLNDPAVRLVRAIDLPQSWSERETVHIYQRVHAGEQSTPTPRRSSTWQSSNVPSKQFETMGRSPTWPQVDQMVGG